VALDGGGVVPALEQLASRAEELFGIRCLLKCDGQVSVCNESAATQVYRIAQEAITNAVRHGKAKHVWMTLNAVKDNVTLTIKDDGAGLPEVPQNNSGMGLRIMRYRAGLIGASLDIERDGSRGTVVTCFLKHREQTG